MLGWKPGSKTPELVDQSGEADHRYKRAAQTREEVTEALGIHVPGEDDEEGRSRDDVRAEIDDAMDAGDMERVRELMAELDELEERESR